MGYRYNKKHPPMFDIYKHDFHGYATDSQETFFYNFAVQGYDVSFRYKGQMHYLMYDKGKAAVCDEHFTKQYIVYPDPNALIEQYEIDGHKLMEIIDELEEVEAVWLSLQEGAWCALLLFPIGIAAYSIVKILVISSPKWIYITSHHEIILPKSVSM